MAVKKNLKANKKSTSKRSTNRVTNKVVKREPVKPLESEQEILNLEHPDLFRKRKKKLSDEQEFEILKLVLDKFLWLGFGIMGFGLYIIIIQVQNIFKGFAFMIVGAVLLILFMMLLIKEYEILK